MELLPFTNTVQDFLSSNGRLEYWESPDLLEYKVQGLEFLQVTLQKSITALRPHPSPLPRKAHRTTQVFESFFDPGPKESYA